ncbi:MAG TPA: hypothetical protein VNS32_02375 [Flavisolibacter sp.]|nr:hypothetical protein [Flavisolibacter sp.]
MKNLIQLSLMALVFIFSSCKKNNDATTVGYQLTTSSQSTAVNRMASTQRMQSGILAWDSGFAYVRTIRFEAKKDSIDVKYRSEVNQRISLFDPLASLGAISLQAGTYRKVEFKADLLSSPTTPSLVLYGHYSDGTTIYPVVFSVSNECNIKGEEEDVTINSGAGNTSVTTINLTALTAGITASDWNNATQTAGVIIVSENVNPRLYSIVSDHLQHLEHKFHH